MWNIAVVNSASLKLLDQGSQTGVHVPQGIYLPTWRGTFDLS